MKVLLNGIKESGQYIPCFYSLGGIQGLPEATITVYANRRNIFGEEVRSQFKVVNDSDSMVDYFEDDYFRVLPEHPLYSEFKDAIEKKELCWRLKNTKKKLKKAKAIMNCKTVRIEGRFWKVITETPKEKQGIAGVSYELTTLLNPKKTYYSWVSEDKKRYSKPFCV
jgi:hypothetical protein